jgi:hypothetical protein
MPGRYVMASTAVFWAAVLNLSPREAGLRVRHAHALGPRVTVIGDRLAPELPAAAAARVAGVITAEHVSVVLRTIRSLPSSIPVPDVVAAEQFLVEQARIFDAKTLAGIARQLKDTLDPDGRLTDAKDQARRRNLTLTSTGDGMYSLRGVLDAATGAKAMAALHALAAPQPSDATGPDERSAGQRLHDAFGAVLSLALRAGTLPASGGVPATVLITMTAEQYESRTGHAATGFGEPMPVSQALRLADEASIAWIVQNSTGAILNYGRLKRLATRNQTLALIARDQGCSFPRCTSPPQWTEKHHITPWHQGGQTDVENMTLLRLSHESRACAVLILVRVRIGRGRECALWRSGSVVVDAAVGAGLAA